MREPICVTERRKPGDAGDKANDDLCLSSPKRSTSEFIQGPWADECATSEFCVQLSY